MSQKESRLGKGQKEEARNPERGALMGNVVSEPGLSPSSCHFQRRVADGCLGFLVCEHGLATSRCSPGEIE